MLKTSYVLLLILLGRDKEDDKEVTIISRSLDEISSNNLHRTKYFTLKMEAIRSTEIF